MAERVLSYKNCLIPPLVFGIVNNTFPHVIYRTHTHRSSHVLMTVYRANSKMKDVKLTHTTAQSHRSLESMNAYQSSTQVSRYIRAL
jgi:hypothetical protein